MLPGHGQLYKDMNSQVLFLPLFSKTRGNPPPVSSSSGARCSQKDNTLSLRTPCAHHVGCSWSELKSPVLGSVKGSVKRETSQSDKGGEGKYPSWILLLFLLFLSFFLLYLWRWTARFILERCQPRGTKSGKSRKPGRKTDKRSWHLIFGFLFYYEDLKHVFFVFFLFYFCFLLFPSKSFAASILRPDDGKLLYRKNSAMAPSTYTPPAITSHQAF